MDRVPPRGAAAGAIGGDGGVDPSASLRAVPVAAAGAAVAMARGAGPALAALLGLVLAVLSRAEPAAGE